MASDFESIRSDLLSQKEEASSGQTLFLFMLIAVLVVGSAIGYMVIPREADTGGVVVAETSAQQVASSTPAKKYKTSELKKMRRAEMRKFRETQAELRHCASDQRHMSVVLTSYTNRNQASFNAWSNLLDSQKKLAEMGQKNSLESTAYVLTGGMQADVRDVFKDIEVELNSYGREIDPIKCGQLNAAVQRRQRDLETPPVS